MEMFKKPKKLYGNNFEIIHFGTVRNSLRNLTLQFTTKPI